MNLPVALGLWLTNAVLAAMLGFWLGRATSRGRAVDPITDETDEPSELLGDLEADAARADEDLSDALADLTLTVEASSASEERLRGQTERLLKSSRTFERRLSRGHGRLSRLAAAAGDVWLALADEVLRHKNRVGDFCRYLEREIAEPSRTAASCSELLAAVRELMERNRRLRQELDAVKSRLAQREARLATAERDARIDPLTRLPNRRAFDERLAACQTRADRGVEPYAVILFDLDAFKTLNDTRGHQFGDAVLAVFGRILNETVRTSDHAARYGGEEFAVLLPGADAAAAAAVAERCRRQAEKATVRRGDVQDSFTVSGGVAAWSPGRTADELLAAADRALYQAKSDGRNRIRIEATDGESDADADASLLASV